MDEYLNKNIITIFSDFTQMTDTKILTKVRK